VARSKTYELSFQVGATLSGSFAKVFKGAESALQQLNGQMGAMGKQQAAQARLIELRESLETSSLKLRAAKQHMEQLGQEMAATANPTKQMQQAMDKAGLAVQKAQTQVDKERGALQQLNTQLGTSGTSTAQLVAHQKRLAEQAEKAAKSQKKLQEVLAAQDANKAKRADLRGQLFDGVALAATLAAPIKAAVEFESSMADVAKVVDFKDGEAGLKNMGQSVIDMSTRLPMAAKDIAQIVALGGQSAVAEQDLTAFAEHAVKMGTAFGMSAEEAGTSMAKMKSAFGMTIPEVATLTDKINLLGNTGAANEKQILSIVARVGPLGEVAGLASGEIAALGSTLAGMGVAEEVAATGIQNLMLSLVQGSAATKAQREALKSLGLDSVKVAKSMQKDATGTMMQVFESLRGKKDWERASIMTQLFGKESIKAIAPLLNQLETLKENFDKVGDAQLYGGAVNKEYATRAATTANQLQLAKNQMAAMGMTLGNVMLPALNDTLKTLMPWMGRITGLAQAYPGLTKALVMGTAALIGIKVAAIAGGYAFTFVRGAVLSVQAGLLAARTGWLLYTGAMAASNTTSKLAIVISKTMAASQWLVNAALSPLRWAAVTAQIVIWRTTAVAAAAGAKVMAAAQWILNAAMAANPIGLVVVGIAALIAAGVALYKNWDTVSAFFVAGWDRMKAAGVAVWEWIKGLSFYDSGMALLQTLADGIMAAVNKPVEAIKGALSKVREFLPFSDAKVGPLSELTLSGQKIMTTLGDGMGQANIADVTAPLSGIAAAAKTSAPAGGAGAGAVPARGGDTYHITISVPAGSDPAGAHAAGRAAARGFEEQMREHEARSRRLSYAPA
jgi:TP901 family phage tail tape measure protein